VFINALSSFQSNETLGGRRWQRASAEPHHLVKPVSQKAETHSAGSLQGLSRGVNLIRGTCCQVFQFLIDWDFWTLDLLPASVPGGSQ